MKNSKRIRIYNIKWNVDVDTLPTEVRCVVFKGIDVTDINDNDEIKNWLDIMLFDDYGYSPNNFNFEEY